MKLLLSFRLFLSTPDGERLYRHAGGIFDPAEFLLLGRYVASGAHRSPSFAAYKQKHKGS